MNSRVLVIGAFIIWSALSWRWYVCSIKQVCASNVEKTQYPAPTPIIEPDSSETVTLQDTLRGASPSTSTEPSSQIINTGTIDPELKVTPANLDRVQIEEVENGVRIHFPYNSTRREDNAAIDVYLQRLASGLVQSGASVAITGHTDMIGDAKNNKSIGLERATHIKKLLVTKGVPASQIKCYSAGEAKPVATNDTPKGRYLNRRVEIKILQR